MEFLLQDIEWNHETADLLIVGNSNESNPTFIIRKKNNGRDFEYKSEIHLEDIERINNSIRIKINLQSILDHKNYPDETIWNIYMITNQREYRVKISNSLKKNLNYFSDEQYIFQVKPYITQDNCLAFFVKKWNANFIAKYINYENGLLTVIIETDNNNQELLLKNLISLKFKKRSQLDLPFHEDTIEIDTINRINGSTIEIVSNVAETIYSKYQEFEAIWDIYLFVNGGNQAESIYPLQINKNMDNDFKYYPLKSNNFYKIKSYITSDKRLALYISSIQKSIFATEVCETDESITLAISKNVQNISDEWDFIIKRKNKIGNNHEYYDTMLLSGIRSQDNLSITVKKNQLLSNIILRENEVWDMFVRVKNKKMHELDLFIDISTVKKRDFHSFSIKGKNDCFQAKLLINKSKTLSILVAEKNVNKKDVMKVAVLGTCFSRNAFNSSSYFNPGYKNIFDCVFTQFHSSLISLVSEKSSLDLDILENISKNDVDFLKMDFDKSFFDKLIQADPDYFIIDLYPDACKSVLKLGENQYVTGSYILERNENVKKLPLVEIIDHSDNDKYFNLWKKAAHTFVSEIKKIISEERIILNKGRFTPVYFDENRNIKNFKDPNLIRRNNYFWEKLDNYFMYILPNVKTIDLTDTNFIGDINYPFGLSYSHYQSEYYKEFLNRLTKIILQDKLK